MHKVTSKLLRHLDNHNVSYRVVKHEATQTSKDSAEARGTLLSEGAKALVLKLTRGAVSEFAVFVLQAHRKLDSKSVKRALSAKKVRFATKSELLDLTGLEPGSVPPFGEPVLPLPCYVDPALIAGTSNVAFNAGSKTFSVIMKTEDFAELEGVAAFAISK